MKCTIIEAELGVSGTEGEGDESKRLRRSIDVPGFVLLVVFCSYEKEEEEEIGIEESLSSKNSDVTSF